MRILGFIMTTFLIAVIYGLYVTTMDFMQQPTPVYDPVASGHHAAGNVYNSFGIVTSEIKRNDAQANVHNGSTASKIAMPYAITADLSAIFGGKIEVAMSGLFHTAQNRVKADQSPPPAGALTSR